METKDILSRSEILLPFDCNIEISVDEGQWLTAPALFDQWIKKLAITTFVTILPDLELDQLLSPASIEVSFLFTVDAHIQILNQNHRGKDSATNVLSFPDTELTPDNLIEANFFKEPLTFGDIAFAEETIRREAAMQGKKFQDHLAHLVVHGILHLAGYDHIDDDEADRMEALEIQILKLMNIDNPYQIDIILDKDVQK